MAASDYMPTSTPEVTEPAEFLAWTGRDKWNAVYTVTIGELLDHDVFSWKSPLLDWSSAAYSTEQYERVCEYFIERFRFREISIIPFAEWAYALKRKLVYELMPKYKMMYALLDDDFDITQIEGEYEKKRVIGSEYPETLLSGNSDYISDGTDEESEKIKRGNLLDSYLKYEQAFTSIDEKLLDECESLFIGLYTASIDGM